MKNLRVYSVVDSSIDADSSDYRGKACVNSLDETLYIFLESKNVILIINKDGEVIKEVPLPDRYGGSLQSCHFLMDGMQLCVAFQSGEIVIFDIENEEFNEAMCLPDTISGASWSPDQHLFVVTTEDTIYGISRDFEIIESQDLRPVRAGKDELVTIGWGSRETQFQGSAGRQNREKVDVNKVPVPITDSEDRRTLISWRGDAQFFTVSTVDEVAGSLDETVLCRQLRVWNRSLELISKCEFLAGVESNLCTKPTGNLIATTRIFDGKCWVWFFEQNGQYRHNFILHNDAENTNVVDLRWNIDSSVLAVHFTRRQSVDSKDRFHGLQFWTCSNYVWMMKLEFTFHESVTFLEWDAEDAEKIHALFRDGRYLRMKLCSEYSCFNGVVGVISGDELKVTNFNEATLPPPMSHYTIKLNGAPAAFSLLDNRLAVIGSDMRSIGFYELNDTSSKTLKLDGGDEASRNIIVYNVQWKADLSGLTAIQCFLSSTGRKWALIEISLTGNVTVISAILSPIIFQTFDCSNNKYEFISDSGEAFELGASDSIPKRLCDFKSVVCNCKLLPEWNLIVAMTKNYQLVVNGHYLHQRCSSFSVVDDFLLITTLDNLLVSIPVSSLAEFISKESADFSPLFGDVRSIERGAHLVTHRCSSGSVWLQMPRGNLEMIYPRSLVISNLKRLLDNTEYGEAVVEMRRHRVDMNLIYDHNPEAFILNIGRFLDQVNNVDYLNLFFTSLTTEDTTKTIFSNQYKCTSEDNCCVIGISKHDGEKVNRICTAVRSALMDRISSEENSMERLSTAILSSFVVERPSKVVDALCTIQAWMKKNYSRDFFAKCIRHLIYLVNEKTLFQQALKTYDMEIVLNVAEISNKDPKEYLPLLNRLRAITPFTYLKYSVDLLLEDWPSALRNIADLVGDARSDEAEPKLRECLDLVKAHKLHSLALEIFCGKPCYQEICKLCADQALATNLLDESAYLYLLAGHIEKALECFTKAANANGCRHLRAVGAISEDALRSALKKIEDQFLLHNNFAALVEMHKDLQVYLEQRSIFINALCKSTKWTDAVYLAKEWFSRDDSTISGATYLTDVDGLVVDRCHTLLSQFEQWRNDLDKHCQRLEIVRDGKHRQLVEWVSQELGADLALRDLAQSETLSEASTHISTLSRLSSATSRKRKQIERKKKQIKEGSQYEDAALLTALKEILNEIDKIQDELRSLLLALLLLYRPDLGRQLQRSATNLVQEAVVFQTRIWPQFVEPKHLPGPLVEIYRCGDGVVRPPNEDNMMPLRIQIEDEMLAPILRQKFSEWNLFVFGET